MELAYKLEPDLASNDVSQIDSRVADVGEKVYIGWQHNLSKGARSEIITDKAQLKMLIELAAKAAEAINIKFASVDIIEQGNGKHTIIEINSGVVLEKFVNQSSERYLIAKKIYEKALIAAFNQG